jgi:D-alanyl-D-alanine carboxypeptidase/D-alanyl-D-alanine-endopeptidase (penicillin-binding protein 4)
MRKALAIVLVTLALPAWAATPTPKLIARSAPAKVTAPSKAAPPKAQAASAKPANKAAGPAKKLASQSAAPAAKKPACKPTDAKPVQARPAPVTVANEVAKPALDEPDRELLSRLQESLEEIVRGRILGRLRVGMQVQALSTGRTLFGWHSSALMDPASNQKVLATTTALLRLGSAFRYRTEVTGAEPDADGKITGDIVVRGNGDPSLRYRQVEALAESLAAKGITRVTGSVLGDPRRIGSDEILSGGRPPLRVGSASIEVHVRPADKVGARPAVSLRPASEAFVVVNQAETVAKGKSRIGVSLDRTGNRIQVLVTGKIAKTRGPVAVQRSTPSHPLFAAILLRQALIQAGIVVLGNAGVYTGDNRSHVADRGLLDGVALAWADGAADAKPVLLAPLASHQPGILAVHESETLAVLLRRVNKDSDNEWAERVLETVGAEVYGGAATTGKGVHALREALADLGLSLPAYLPSNGSGLGHQNRVTASGMVALLRHLYFDPRIGPDLMQSLSVGGVDGTTRNRFRGSSAAHRVRAKTGTLNGVSCLSGFVGDGAEILAFSILVEGHRRRAVASVRLAQVSAVNAMMRFARGSMGPLPVEETTPGNDFETGDETDEEDTEALSPENSDLEHATQSPSQVPGTAKVSSPNP